MQGLFGNCINFNQDISGWNTINVTTMNSMFQGATSFDQDIRAWNISKVTNFTNMFSGATAMLARYPTLTTVNGIKAWFASA